MVIISAIVALAMDAYGKPTSENTHASVDVETRVAAASDLGRASSELARSFEKETSIKVTLIFGSTGLLAKQIESGAPFDAFAAADEKYLLDLEAKGRVVNHTRR